MRGPVKKIYDLASNAWFVVIAGASSIVALIGWLYEKADPEFSHLSWVKATFKTAIEYAGDPGTLVLIAMAGLFLLGFIYSIRVRWENMSLRKMSQVFYEINLLYKEQLQRCFGAPTPTIDPRTRLEGEKETLGSVCQRISKIYTMAIGRPCLVTIKLVGKSDDGLYVQTYVRSESQCLRDQTMPNKFILNTNQNTCYDDATLPGVGAKPSHYFSPNLRDDENYNSQRLKHLQYYKSILVVPIRGELSRPDSLEKVTDLVGFLAVDTMSTNRLNSTYHLYMLAALSHQIYNFISLMRGQYSILAKV